jgi:hypothetical protein
MKLMEGRWLDLPRKLPPRLATISKPSIEAKLVESLEF